MTNSPKSAIPVLVACLVIGVVSTHAADWGHSPIEADRYVVQDIFHPLAPVSITHSVDPNTLVSGTSVACVGAGTTDTGWWRLFDLDADFGLVGEFCTTSVDYGVETAVGPTQNITANVYCLDDGLPFLTVFLSLAGTTTQQQPDADIEFFNIEVEGCCDTAIESMAVELLSDDCQETGTCLQLFIGMNDLGQTAPSYISAADCGIVDPVDLAEIGFPNAHLVMVVNSSSNDEPDGGGDGGVPASTGTGGILMILALLGTSAVFLRLGSSA